MPNLLASSCTNLIICTVCLTLWVGENLIKRFEQGVLPSRKDNCRFSAK